MLRAKLNPATAKQESTAPAAQAEAAAQSGEVFPVHQPSLRGQIGPPTGSKTSSGGAMHVPPATSQLLRLACSTSTPAENQAHSMQLLRDAPCSAAWQLWQGNAEY
ncbi:hypothetical protein WJX84_006144 [Apatococcus fuscideae]|uniref:Uncharacterized protein n=1 Tax=Apatococcus fuscideae TaxID=2026836 RepID=A0AAW1T6D4_9CHLO